MLSFQRHKLQIPSRHRCWGLLHPPANNHWPVPGPRHHDLPRRRGKCMLFVLRRLLWYRLYNTYVYPIYVCNLEKHWKLEIRSTSLLKDYCGLIQLWWLSYKQIIALKAQVNTKFMQHKGIYNDFFLNYARLRTAAITRTTRNVSLSKSAPAIHSTEGAQFNK